MVERMARFGALLVEGIPGAGKSTLIDALIRRHVGAAPARKVRSFLHLAQTHTYGPLASAEDSGTLTVAANLDHLARIVAVLEVLSNGVQNPAHPPCFVLVDTLHLTHCLRPGVLAWTDAQSIDSRLAALRVKLLVLRAEPGAVWERLIYDRAQTQFLREYCSKFGRTDEELHAHFLHEQERFTEMFERSTMRKALMCNDALDGVLDDAYQLWIAG
jgi:hypothetical protein